MQLLSDDSFAVYLGRDVVETVVEVLLSVALLWWMWMWMWWRRWWCVVENRLFYFVEPRESTTSNTITRSRIILQAPKSAASGSREGGWVWVSTMTADADLLDVQIPGRDFASALSVHRGAPDVPIFPHFPRPRPSLSLYLRPPIHGAKIATRHRRPEAQYTLTKHNILTPPSYASNTSPGRPLPHSVEDRGDA